MLTITPKDALRSTVITPGWYRVLVTNQFNKAATTDGSNLFKYEIEVVEARGTKDKKFAGVPLKEFQISEKAVGFGIPFLLACGFPQSELDKVKAGQPAQVDETKPVGQQIYALIANTKYENRINNEAVDFLAIPESEK